jgi:hypothetical protein
MSVRRTAAALLTAGLLLTGCSDDPEPRFEPTETPSPTESSATAEPQAQSPEEFIREWFALNTEMQNTGETEAFLSLSRNCQACEDLAERVDSIYSAGGFIRLKRQEVMSIKAGSRSTMIKQFDVTVRVTPTQYRESERGPVEEFSGGTARTRITVVRNQGQWFMESLVQL